jgi:hypothetical protein
MMHRGSRQSLRVWVEAAASVFSAVLFFVTLAVPDWIEVVFHVDPDHGGGLLEWGVVFAAGAASVCSLALARKAWRGPEAVPAGPSASGSDG